MAAKLISVYQPLIDVNAGTDKRYYSYDHAATHRVAIERFNELVAAYVAEGWYLSGQYTHQVDSGSHYISMMVSR